MATEFTVKIPKKGDKTTCHNWKAITLFCVMSKITAQLALQQIKPKTEKRLRQNQAGCRPRHACMDHIGIL